MDNAHDAHSVHRGRREIGEEKHDRETERERENVTAENGLGVVEGLGEGGEREEDGTAREPTRNNLR